MLLKLLYIAPRPRSATLDQFRTRWRQHFDLALTRPAWSHVTTYDQCDYLPPEEFDRGNDVNFIGADAVGGVAMAGFTSAADLAEITNAPDRHIMLLDEREVFGRELGTAVTLVHEAIVFGHEVPGYKLFAFFRPADSDRAAFAAGSDRLYWHAAGVGFPGTVSSLILDVLAGRPGLNGYDGVMELGFRTRNDIGAFVRSDLSSVAELGQKYTAHPEITYVITRNNRLLDRSIAG